MIAKTTHRQQERPLNVKTARHHIAAAPNSARKISRRWRCKRPGWNCPLSRLMPHLQLLQHAHSRLRPLFWKHKSACVRQALPAAFCTILSQLSRTAAIVPARSLNVVSG
jgi:hypothetical protein